MTPQIYETEDGFPGVAWEQEVPTGETEFSRRRELQWRAAVLVGLAVFGAALGAGLPASWAVSGSLIAALVVASPEIQRSLAGAAPGAGESENERLLEAEARVARLMRPERRWAEVALDRPTRTLDFLLMESRRDVRNPTLRLPLFSFAEFELGTDEEWLGDAASRELREMARLGAAWVIVTQTAEGGVLLIARSGRDKSGMAELHRVLTAAFIAARPALLAKLEEMMGA